MHESGLMNKWITEQIPTKDKCSDISSNQGVDERKVNVTDMQGIFFVLFMGNVFCLSIIVGEIIIPRGYKTILLILLVSGVAGSIFLLCCEFYWHRRQVMKRRKLIQPFLS